MPPTHPSNQGCEVIRICSFFVGLRPGLELHKCREPGVDTSIGVGVSAGLRGESFPQEDGIGKIWETAWVSIPKVPLSQQHCIYRDEEESNRCPGAVGKQT